MTLDGATSTAIPAPESSDGAFSQHVLHLPIPAPGTRDLSFHFDGPDGSVAQVADITLLVGADVDPIDGGSFVDGSGQAFSSVTDAGWNVAGSGTATLRAVPEPAMTLSAVTAFGALLGLSRRR